MLLFSRKRPGNRGGPFGDWLVHAVAKSSLVVEPTHFVTLDAKAGLTRVGFAKRTRNLKPRFSHAHQRSPATVPRLHPVKTVARGAATLFTDAPTGFLLRPRVFLDEINPRCQSRR